MKQGYENDVDFFKSVDGINESGYLLKAQHKYIKRTGVPGKYQYWYKNPETGKVEKQNNKGEQEIAPEFKKLDDETLYAMTKDKNEYRAAQAKKELESRENKPSDLKEDKKDIFANEPLYKKQSKLVQQKLGKYPSAFGKTLIYSYGAEIIENWNNEKLNNKYSDFKNKKGVFAE